MTSEKSLIEFIGVHKSYDRLNVLKDVNLSIEKGEFVFIIGQSGVGKTTLLKMIYLEEFPDRGKVKIFGIEPGKSDIQRIRSNIGVIFQDFKLLDYRTIYDNVYMPLGYTGVPGDMARKRVEEALRFVKLWDRKDELPANLSGGEKQRVSIARAIARQPALLIADEPTGNLDPETSLEILDYLKKLNEQGMTVIVATHDYSLIENHPSATVYRIDYGSIVPVEGRDYLL